MAKQLKIIRNQAVCPVCNRKVVKEMAGNPVKYMLCDDHNKIGHLTVIVIDMKKSGSIQGVHDKLNPGANIEPENAYRTGNFFYVPIFKIKDMPFLKSSYCYLDKNKVHDFLRQINKPK